MNYLTIPNAENRALTNYNDAKFNSTATVECDLGYYNEIVKQQDEGISATVIKCDKTGKWSNLPNCVKKGEYDF